MNCKFCTNYMTELDRCKYCSFEFNGEYDDYKSDDWDILNLPSEDWEHIQISDRLHLKGIEHWSADIWYNNDMAYITGCYADNGKIARALNINEEIIYSGTEQGLVILNLFQEKYMRGELDE